MSEHPRSCISDGEEEPDDCQNDYPICDNYADIRKNLLYEFDVVTKEKTSSGTSGRECVKVYLRARPFSSEELEANEDQQCVERESRTTVLMKAPKESFAFKNSTRAGGEISHRFSFTNVFSEDTTQKEFFDETTLPLVTDFINGQNCLVFTYGVANSGKTYTIQGTPKDGGILPRSLDVLFNSIAGKSYERMNLKPRFCTDIIRLTDDEEQKENNFKSALLSSLNKVSYKSSIDNKENVSRVADDTTINVDTQGPVKFSVWVSFAEIYNETIFDLLEPYPTGIGKKRTALRLGDDSNGNPYIKGLREIYVSNADEAYKILKIGQNNQRIASTKLNQCSSRSHCIFSIKVLRVVDVDDPHVARVSRLSFVDLAGSERYSKTQSKGDRLKEAGNINTSLMTLGKCLEYLRYNQKNSNQPLIIPFRESKLTRLFQGFFCGKGRAALIVNVNMCASMFDETFHVMKFSAIAKKVRKYVAATPCSKPARPSVPWIKGALYTSVPCDDTLTNVDEDIEEESQLVGLVKVLQEQLIEEKRKMQTLEIKIREEVCKEMAEQLVSIEDAYSPRVKMEVNTVEEKSDCRIEPLTQLVKKSRKRARIERAEDDDEEWVPSMFLHAEQTKVWEQQRLVGVLNAQIAELRHEIKQLKENKQDKVATSEAVLELQAHFNPANEEAAELKQMLEEAGEAFSEKEAEISKLKAALDEQEACIKKQMRSRR
ncbi:kinesin-like protein KIF20A [Stylophora pistillata]|uniref:kinesin-like protein KIF20A n=1 Tax=Stylophora pistillata TaxID=50429 RepID=UPI000C03C347|nr:kinesin-like protein KIF20A [Stylophora pistillata]